MSLLDWSIVAWMFYTTWWISQSAQESVRSDIDQTGLLTTWYNLVNSDLIPALSSDEEQSESDLVSIRENNELIEPLLPKLEQTRFG